jgi:hypothetical protein
MVGVDCSSSNAASLYRLGPRRAGLWAAGALYETSAAPGAVWWG